MKPSNRENLFKQVQQAYKEYLKLESEYRTLRFSRYLGAMRDDPKFANRVLRLGDKLSESRIKLKNLEEKFNREALPKMISSMRFRHALERYIREKGIDLHVVAAEAMMPNFGKYRTKPKN
jgi:hypothetical protein